MKVLNNCLVIIAAIAAASTANAFVGNLSLAVTHPSFSTPVTPLDANVVSPSGPSMHAGDHPSPEAFAATSHAGEGRDTAAAVHAAQADQMGKSDTVDASTESSEAPDQAGPPNHDRDHPASGKK